VIGARSVSRQRLSEVKRSGEVSQHNRFEDQYWVKEQSWILEKGLFLATFGLPMDRAIRSNE
jgi:hypothetical protein